MSLRLSIALVLFSAASVACGSSAPAPEASAAKESAAAPTAPQPSAGPSVVRLGYQKIGTPYLLKHRSEPLDAELAKHGVKAEWIEFQAGPPILEAIRAGAVDIGYVGETPPVFGQAGGVPFVYVAAEVSAPAAEAIVVPKDSPLQSVADLKGKKIALNRGSNVHYLLLRALESVQLGIGDLEVVYLAPPDARSAFASGQVDAWVIWDPYYAAAEEAGARTLRDGEDLVVNRFFYVAGREFAEKNPALLATVMQQYERLSGWARTHTEESAQILSESSGVAYEALLRAEQRHVYELEKITPDVLAAQQNIADAFQKLELIPRAIRTQDAFLASAAFGSGS